MLVPSVAGSMPSTRSSPSETGEMQPIIRIVEVFPAPLGPRKPNASPCSTRKSTASTATNSPKRFVRRRPSMSGAGHTSGDAIGGRADGVAD